jgi:hypothetical protein
MTREPHAHALSATEPPQPLDSWQRDLSLVLGAIAVLLIIATTAILLNPVKG